MAEFVIGDVKQVREFTWPQLVNSHLADGWGLLLVRAGQEIDRNFDTGKEENVATTVFVIGWIGDNEPKSELLYRDELRAEPPVDEADLY